MHKNNAACYYCDSGLTLFLAAFSAVLQECCAVRAVKDGEALAVKCLCCMEKLKNPIEKRYATILQMPLIGITADKAVVNRYKCGNIASIECLGMPVIYQAVFFDGMQNQKRVIELTEEVFRKLHKHPPKTLRDPNGVPYCQYTQLIHQPTENVYHKVIQREMFFDRLLKAGLVLNARNNKSRLSQSAKLTKKAMLEE